MFTHSQREDCPLIHPQGLQTPRLHTPVIQQMLLPASQCGFSGNPAGPLSLVCIPVHGGFEPGNRHQTTHQASNHTEFHAKNFTYILIRARCLILPLHRGPEGPDELLSPEPGATLHPGTFCLSAHSQKMLLCLQIQCLGNCAEVFVTCLHITPSNSQSAPGNAGPVSG